MAEKKGKPTPKRTEAQAKLKVSSLSPAASKEAKRALKEQNRIRRLEARAAYMRGEESALPYRDKGPARRFVRNYIDERRSISEYFLVVIMVVLFLTIMPIPAVQLVAVAIMYSSMIFMTVNGILLSRKLKKLVAEKFPNESTKGIGMYGWMRSTQLRRLRAPAPQTIIAKRGQK
jgi:ABC-type bacteriocin/lantibiotic exporter with double-glycine peptidase domain